MSNDELPAILVSAVDVAAASEIIRELISEGVEPPQTNGAGAGHGDEADEPAGSEARGVVWRLENKYYSAAVRLLMAPDRPARPPTPHADLQAHLIYLTEDECADESACVRRAAAAAAAGRLARGAVRLVGARCAAPPPALAAAARAARYELVPLAAPPPPPPDDPDDEPPEAAGVARLREALHAHPWPGLIRRGRVDAPLYFAEDVCSSDSSNSSWGSWRRAGEGGAGDEAGAVERAEQFAAALAALPAARGGGGGGGGGGGAGGGGGGGDAERRLRAEQLVGAFCRALGHPLPPPPPTDP